jgi:hypothetical protein
MLNGIVSPLQTIFILGRGNMDNAIILHEFICHMHKSKRKKGDKINKFDLEKAND